MQGLGMGMAGPAQLPTGFLCSIHTTFQGEGAFTEMCIQGILFIEKTQGSSKYSVNHFHDALSIIIHANITLVRQSRKQKSKNKVHSLLNSPLLLPLNISSIIPLDKEQR